MAAYMYLGRTWGVSAQIAGEELERIESRDGEITPRAVVEEARPEGSKLHNVFEWDDEKAAEQYRLTQASHFIRCIVVKPMPEEKIKEPVRMYINQNPTDSGQSRSGSYINLRSALENPDSRAVVLANAMHEMKVFRAKYSKLKELSEVFKAMDSVLEDS
jgi:hypothetical protein